MIVDSVIYYLPRAGFFDVYVVGDNRSDSRGFHAVQVGAVTAVVCAARTVIGSVIRERRLDGDVVRIVRGKCASRTNDILDDHFAREREGVARRAGAVVVDPVSADDVQINFVTRNRDGKDAILKMGTVQKIVNASGAGIGESDAAVVGGILVHRAIAYDVEGRGTGEPAGGTVASTIVDSVVIASSDVGRVVAVALVPAASVWLYFGGGAASEVGAPHSGTHAVRDFAGDVIVVVEMVVRALGGGRGGRVGRAVGGRVGRAVGRRVGRAVGGRVGGAVGGRVGRAVGWRGSVSTALMGGVRSAASGGAPVTLGAAASPGVPGGAVADATFSLELAAVGAVVARVGGRRVGRAVRGSVGGAVGRGGGGELAGTRGRECGRHRGQRAAVIHPGGAAASVTNPASDC